MVFQCQKMSEKDFLVVYYSDDSGLASGQGCHCLLWAKHYACLKICQKEIWDLEVVRKR